jgi:hypothetical protein
MSQENVEIAALTRRLHPPVGSARGSPLGPLSEIRVGACRMPVEGRDDMKRRIRTAAASVIVTAGLIGAVAAPASADKPGILPTVPFIIECNTPSGPVAEVYRLLVRDVYRFVHQTFPDCELGTVRITRLDKPSHPFFLN